MKRALALSAAGLLIVASLGSSTQEVREQQVFDLGVEAGRAERQSEIDSLQAKVTQVMANLDLQQRVTWDGRQWVQLDESRQWVEKIRVGDSWIESDSTARSPGSDASPTTQSACERGGCPGGTCPVDIGGSVFGWRSR